MEKIRSTRANKRRQVRDAERVDARAFHPPGAEKAGWGTHESPENLGKFLRFGGRVNRLMIGKKTEAVAEYISLPKLLRAFRKKNKMGEWSALRGLAENKEAVHDLRRDYREIPQNRIFYVHGIARLPEQEAETTGRRLAKWLYGQMHGKKPLYLKFSFVEASPPNERSLRTFLKLGGVIDATVPGAYSMKKDDPHVRIVRLPVPIMTSGEEKRVPLGDGKEFYARVKALVDAGHIGIGFDGKSRSIIFRKKTTT